jgi:hypothetical protein
MCATKEETKSKIDRLIQALDRHTSAIERLLIANAGKNGLKGNAGCFRGSADALSLIP